MQIEDYIRITTDKEIDADTWDEVADKIEKMLKREYPMTKFNIKLSLI